MTHNRRKMLLIAPFAILAMAGFVFLVMSLWNWLIPALFGGKLITYWQALGLLVLSRILVGGLGGQHRSGRRKIVTNWDQLTPEEQEKFRVAMHRRCGGNPGVAQS
ncbi:MAG TPA: hypothetical protein VMT15_08140 [Bryobacteraceae bacterium]|nr:hypothetical protein [Bryobacteraceae bacterium]